MSRRANHIMVITVTPSKDAQTALTSIGYTVRFYLAKRGRFAPQNVMPKHAPSRSISARQANPSGELVLTDLSAAVPTRRKKAEDLDTKLELRIALALEAGSHKDLAAASRLNFETMLEALATSTKMAIASDVDCFVDWCLSENRTAFPAEAETMVRYIAARAEAGAKPGTIRRRVASISAAHRMLEIEPEGPQALMVRKKLSAVTKAKGGKQRQAYGLRLGAEEMDGEARRASLQGLLAACDQTLTGLRDGALLSAGYDAGLRVSELTAMKVENLTFCADRTGRFSIERSKTDQTGEGALVWLSAETMRRIGRWLEEADIRSGVVFRRVHVRRRKPKPEVAPEAAHAVAGRIRNHQDRFESSASRRAVATYTPGTEPLTRQGVNEIYRRVAKRAWAEGHINVPKDDISGFLKALSSHSLRVGLTQDLIASGQEGVAIAQALRWKSTARVLHYGKELEPDSGAAQAYLKDVRK